MNGKKPWSKEAEKIFKQLNYYGKAYTTDTKQLPKQFGIKCKDIINQDLLDIATIRNKKTRKTLFVTPPDVIVKPYQNKYIFKRIKL